jgi:3-oxoacyl-[acyl-carrier protein] reductase
MHERVVVQRNLVPGFVAGLARQSRLASRNVTINNLLPGFFDTDRIRTAMQTAAERSGKSVAELTAARAKAIPAQRLGIAGEFGEVCAFLCSAQAGYLTGRNILLDGGAYPGTF